MSNVKTPSPDLLSSQASFEHETGEAFPEIIEGNIKIPDHVGSLLTEQIATVELGSSHNPQEKSTEQRSVERLNALVSMVEELEAKKPEVAGVTLFGSTVRGHAKETSDLDLNVFIEVPEDALTSDPPKVKATENGRAHMHKLTFPSGLDYRIDVRNMIKDHKLPESDITILPINESIVRDEVSELLQLAEKNYVEAGQINGWSPRNIRALFHMPVGGNSRLEKYQQQVIEQLSNAEYGKLGWYMIWNKVAYFEQGREGQFEGDFRRMAFNEPPIKLADARDAYGVEMSNAISDSFIPHK